MIAWIAVGPAVVIAVTMAVGANITVVALVAAAFAFTGAFTISLANFIAVGGAFLGVFGFGGAAVATGIIGVVSFAVIVITDQVAARRRLGAFWMAYWPIALGIAGLGLWLAGNLGSTPVMITLPLMISLLPLVNLPFDWASIGTTRALLRRGCEDHGTWLLRSPLLLGLLDFLFGLALMAVLALALVLTLSAADAILLHARARPVFDAVGLIERIAAQPDDWAHGWVYFTLLSTLLPSFCNLLVGVFSLLAFSVPPVRHWLIKTIPTLDEPELPGTRWQVAFALSAQWFCGVVLTGLGLWLVWQAVLLVPGAEQVALVPLHAFAIWCARLLGLPEIAVT